jgi:hypothetical protein
MDHRRANVYKPTELDKSKKCVASIHCLRMTALGRFLPFDTLICWELDW